MTQRCASKHAIRRQHDDDPPTPSVRLHSGYPLYRMVDTAVAMPKPACCFSCHVAGRETPPVRAVRLARCCSKWSKLCAHANAKSRATRTHPSHCYRYKTRTCCDKNGSLISAPRRANVLACTGPLQRKLVAAAPPSNPQQTACKWLDQLVARCAV